MADLLDSPSGGQSEVLETLHYQGAIGNGVMLVRIGPMVSHRWGFDEDTEGSDAPFEADVRTVLGTLQGLGKVIGRNDLTGAIVDLTATPPGSTRVALTATGRVDARHPRPRPQRDPYSRH